MTKTAMENWDAIPVCGLLSVEAPVCENAMLAGDGVLVGRPSSCILMWGVAVEMVIWVVDTCHHQTMNIVLPADLAHRTPPPPPPPPRHYPHPSRPWSVAEVRTSAESEHEVSRAPSACYPLSCAPRPQSVPPSTVTGRKCHPGQYHRRRTRRWNTASAPSSSPWGRIGPVVATQREDSAARTRQRAEKGVFAGDRWRGCQGGGKPCFGEVRNCGRVECAK
jgi:hypothetical protein